VAGAIGTASATSGDPQSPQNFLPGSFAPPHDAQISASGLPQSPQNFLSEELSTPQFEQMTTGRG
jgi:hypothetical protein